MISLWIVLVLALLGMLAVFAIVLLRKSVAVLQEFSDLVGRTAILDGVHRAEPEARPTPAALAGTAAARARWRELRHDGRERRAERRTARISRARRLVSADATAIHWFQR